MKVKAVLLDAGETLITPRQPLTDQLVELGGIGRRLDVGLDVVKQAFEEVWTERYQRVPAGVERYRTVVGGAPRYWREVLLQTFARVGTPIRDSEADRLYEGLCRPSSWVVFDDVVDTLRALRTDGFLLAVASNWDRGLPAILAGLGLTAHFDHVGVSELVGHEKPAAAFFSHVIGALGIERHEAVHVGDRVHDDLEGARGAGLHGLVIDRRGILPDAPWVMRSLGELPARLGRA